MIYGLKNLLVLLMELSSAISYFTNIMKRNFCFFSLRLFQIHMGMQFSEEEVEEMMQEVDCDATFSHNFCIDC
uniref:EF-hand domain-containing protein n=1 Tax=Heterorhabditis bacteriophora TaxID=37862 RepID=A0A1I7WM41_HETBA